MGGYMVCGCCVPAAKAANGGPVQQELARQMDGAMLAIGALADTLKAKVSLSVQLLSCPAA